jgi:HD superfamily phosphohydrolase
MAKKRISPSEVLDKELTSFRRVLGHLEPGPIENLLKSDVAKLLDTKSMQLLSERYQLGLLRKVSDNGNWHNALHTRLDHTIGVVAKCIVACDVINSNTNPHIKRTLNESDARELVVAAALHDCGHLPVSHASERALLTAKGLTSGITHEERIVPLIINRNPLFEDLQNLIISWGVHEHFFFRVACIISPGIANEYVRTIHNFKLPKRAIQQLLVSQIDMDRLDYIIRDSVSLNYSPVTLIRDSTVKYVNGLLLEKSKTLSQGNPDDNAELCIKHEYVQNVFYLLVSRVLLYKYIYFSEKVRSFEAILTNLIGVLIDKGIALEPLKLLAMSDDYFIDHYLVKLVDFIDDPNLKKHLIEKHIKVLQNEKVGRFRHLLSIHAKHIGNPRLKEEFIENISKQSYIDNLRDYVFSSVKKRGVILEKSDILLDVFHLKTGGGDLLVRSDKENEDHTITSTYKTLKDYMNGSNMHRLCTEIRLDVYIKSDLNSRKKDLIRERILSFFKYNQNG